jgi:hypothetical protein
MEKDKQDKLISDSIEYNRNLRVFPIRTPLDLNSPLTQYQMGPPADRQPIPPLNTHPLPAPALAPPALLPNINTLNLPGYPSAPAPPATVAPAPPAPAVPAPAIPAPAVPAPAVPAPAPNNPQPVGHNLQQLLANSVQNPYIPTPPQVPPNVNGHP